MTRPHAQKLQPHFNYSNSTAEGVARVQKKGDSTAEEGHSRRGGRGGSGATDTYTVDYSNSINWLARPTLQKRGGKSLIYSIMTSSFCHASYLLSDFWGNSGTVRWNLRKLASCFAGTSGPVPSPRSSISSPVRASMAVAAVLWAGASYAGATGTGAAVSATVTVTAREWWMLGMGMYSTVVLMWLCAGVVMAVGRLQKLFASNPPEVINNTPGEIEENWMSELENRSAEPALLVEQPCCGKKCAVYDLDGCSGKCSASKAGVRTSGYMMRAPSISEWAAGTALLKERNEQ